MLWGFLYKGVEWAAESFYSFHFVPLAYLVRFQPSTGTSLVLRVHVGCQVPLQLALLTFN